MLLTDLSRKFYTSFLIEDRNTTHRERINTSRNIVRLKPNDIVMAQIEVQSDKGKG